MSNVRIAIENITSGGPVDDEVNALLEVNLSHKRLAIGAQKR